MTEGRRRTPPNNEEKRTQPTWWMDEPRNQALIEIGERVLRIAVGEVADRYTTRAQMAIGAGAVEAMKLGSEVLDTSHLLLGLLADPSSVASKLLAGHGIKYNKAKKIVVGDAGRTRSLGRKELPGQMTAGARRALIGTALAAKNLHHHYRGTEHVLLSLMALRGTDVVQNVFKETQVTEGDIRSSAITLLTYSVPEEFRRNEPRLSPSVY
ncbi:MAG TPA: Clp protease N-terminal domain-containing protein [Candidatus Saccharimonadales bacterium]|nr:Clp protease N-terminal domain-containing protein [Candidatus Saccharimonadales bacterium]